MMMDICIVCRDDLVAKKRYEKQKLISLESSLSETLESLLLEVNGTRFRREEFQKKVICRKCKGLLSNYHKAKVCILERLKNRSPNHTSNTSPHTPRLTTGAKRPGQGTEGVLLPKD